MDFSPFKGLLDAVAGDMNKHLNAQWDKSRDTSVRKITRQRPGGMFGRKQTMTVYARGGYLYTDESCSTQLCDVHGIALTDDIDQVIRDHGYALDWR